MKSRMKKLIYNAIERQEGETDEELRKRIIEIVKKKGVSKP